MVPPSKITIIANGEINDFEYHKSFLNKADLIIAADGGANHCHRLEITPNYIIGDLDSTTDEILSFYRVNNITEIIYDPDQDKTDLELAINLAVNFNPQQIIILGALGGRLDHTLANLLVLKYIPNYISTHLIDENHDVQFVKDKLQIQGNPGETISIIPLTPVQGLSYQNLKWSLNNNHKPLGWFGICNVMLGDEAEISLSSGEILVIHLKNITKKL